MLQTLKSLLRHSAAMAITLGFLTSQACAQGVTTGWTNWTPPSSYSSTANTLPLTGWWGDDYIYTPSLSGSLTLPDSSVVGVTLAGEVIGEPGSTEFQTSGSPGVWNDATAFTSANVPTLPPNGTRLALAGWGAATQTLTFSAPVSNLTLYISSLGSPGTPATWTFNQPVSVLSKGTDPFTVSSNGLELTGREGKGVVQFPGTFTSFSWTVSAPEMFAFWNLGVTSASLSPKPGMLAVSYWAPTAGAGGDGTWLADSNAFWAPNSNGSGTKELWGNGTAVFGGTAGTVTPSGAVLAGSLSFTRTGYTLAASGTTGSTIQLVGSAPGIQLSSGVAATINTNLVASGVLAVTGTGTRGTATLGGLVTAADGVQVTGANLRLSGTVQGDVALAAGASLGGTGRINGTVSGAGTVAPGNSPGIVTADAVDPSGGTDFVFEFSGTAPNYANASASVNDVLRLTGSTPFTSALTAANTKTLFLNFTKDALTVGTGTITSLTGGFFTDQATDFAALLNNATWDNGGFQVYVRGDGLGTDNRLDGVGYYNWRNPAMFGWEQSLFLSTVPQTANFGSGDVNGQVMLLTVAVPEPATWALALAGLIGGGCVVRRRRSRAPARTLVALLVVMACLCAAPLSAADRYYDVDPATAPIDGGTANWADANWKAAAGDTTGVTWAANDTAIFDAIVGSPSTTTITLGGAETATAVTFNAPGYTLTGGTLALAGAGDGNWITMNADGTIASALSVMRFKGSAQATISGGGALGGNRIVLGDGGSTTVTVRQTAGAITTSDYMMVGGNNVANSQGSYIIDGGSLLLSSGAYLGWGHASSSGTITQNGGTVTIGGQGLQLGIGGGSGSYVLNGGTLDSFFGNDSSAGLFTFGGGTFKAATDFTATTARLASTTIAAGATAIIDTNGRNVTWTRELTGSQAAGLTKSGFGTLVLNGNFTGAVRVERGLLQVSSATSLGNGTVTIPDVPLGTLASWGGAIDLNGFSFSNDFYVGNRSAGPAEIGALHNSAVGTTSVLSGNIQIGGENYGGGAGNTVFNGLVTGGTNTHYAFFKRDAGTWTFTNAANTFDGFWYQIGGTTEVKTLANINEASSLGRPTTSDMNQVRFGFNGGGGGRILVTGSTASVSDRAFVLQGDRAADSNRIDASGVNPTATLTLNGNVTAGSGYTFALGGTNAGVNVYAGTIGNGTNLALLKDGSTTWRLTGSNTYSGATTVAGGVLSLGSAGALAGGGNVVFTGGTLQFTAGNTVDYGSRIKNSTAAIAIDTNGQSVTLAGGIDATNGSGLMKSGAGTLVLGGSNAYTGTTTVAAGRLAVNGSIAGGATVQAGATLGGAGTIGGTVSGAGTVSPGNSPGILTAAAVDPTAGTDFVFEFSGTAPNYANAAASVNDVLRLTGSTPFTSALTAANTKTLFLNFSKTDLTVGTGTITSLTGGFFTDQATDFAALLNNATWDNGGFQVYVLGDGQGTDNRLDGVGYYNWRNPAMFGWTQSLFLSTVPQTANFGSGDVNGQVMLLTVAVPEPSTCLMAFAGLACGGYLVRRRVSVKSGAGRRKSSSCISLPSAIKGGTMECIAIRNGATP